VSRFAGVDRTPRAFGTVFVFAALSVPAASVSAEPAPAESAAASASASAAPAPATAKLLAGADVPSEPSPVPAAREWSSAKLVKPARGGTGMCKLSLLREWLKFHCDGYAGAGLVAGDPKGVSVSVTQQDQPLVTTVVLPLRRGESKIVTFLGQEFESYGGATFHQAAMLSIVWRAGRPDPVLVMR
jgi:hypothetical protein